MFVFYTNLFFTFTDRLVLYSLGVHHKSERSIGSHMLELPRHTRHRKGQASPGDDRSRQAERCVEILRGKDKEGERVRYRKGFGAMVDMPISSSHHQVPGIIVMLGAPLPSNEPSPGLGCVRYIIAFL